MSIFINIISILMCVVGSGCVGEIGDVKNEKTPYITFEVPNGWEIVDDQQNGGNIWAVLRTEENYVYPNVSVELYPNNEKGDDSLAQQKAEEIYRGTYCPETPCGQAEFRVIELPSGDKIYTAFGPRDPKSWYTRDKVSDSSWVANFTTSKGGYVLNFTFSDRPDLYIDELDFIVRTMKVELK